jgi:hypothetical protein
MTNDNERLYTSAETEAMAATVERVSKQIQPLLSGIGPHVQGAVLADLFALWLAGHMGPGAEEYHEVLIGQWLSTVRRLVPVCRDQILARTKSGGNA